MPEVDERTERLRQFERRLVRDATLLLDEHSDALSRLQDAAARGDHDQSLRRQLAATVLRNQERWARLVHDRRADLASGHPVPGPDDGTTGGDAFFAEYRRRLAASLDRAEQALAGPPAPVPQHSGPLLPADVHPLIEQHDRIRAELYPDRP